MALMNILLLPLLWSAITATTQPVSTQVRPDANTRHQVRAIRAMIPAGLQFLKIGMGRVENRQSHDQFPLCIESLRWALGESKVFKCESADDLRARMPVLCNLLSQNSLFTRVLPSVESLFTLLTDPRYTAAYLKNFEAAHCRTVGAAVDLFLSKLALAGNSAIRRLLTDLGNEQVYRDQAGIANSFANFLSFVVRQNAIPIPDAKLVERYELQLALRGLRRFNHIVLPTPNDLGTGRFLFGLLKRLNEALAHPNRLPDLYKRASAVLIANFKDLGSADLAFMASKAQAVFMEDGRTRNFIKFLLSSFLTKYEGKEDAAADLFTLGVYYVAKSMVKVEEEGEEPLVRQFLSRLGVILCPKDYHLSEFAHEALTAMATRIQTAPNEHTDAQLGVIITKVGRFLGHGNNVDFNDTLITQLVAVHTQDMDLDEVKGCYYDYESHRTLRFFFGDQNEDEPATDFPTIVLKHYRKAGGLTRPDYGKQRRALEAFMKDLYDARREARGALIRLIARRRDYLAEAGVLMRLADYGIRFADCKWFAAAIGDASPKFLGHPQEDMDLSISLDSQEMTSGMFSVGSSLSPHQERSEEDQVTDSQTESGSQDASSGDHETDGGQAVNESLNQLLTL